MRQLLYLSQLLYLGQHLYLTENVLKGSGHRHQTLIFKQELQNCQSWGKIIYSISNFKILIHYSHKNSPIRSTKYLIHPKLTLTDPLLARRRENKNKQRWQT